MYLGKIAFWPNTFGPNAKEQRNERTVTQINLIKITTTPSKLEGNPPSSHCKTLLFPYLPMLFTICNFRKLQ